MSIIPTNLTNTMTSAIAITNFEFVIVYVCMGTCLYQRAYSTKQQTIKFLND